jgi:hypothetical protein
MDKEIWKDIDGWEGLYQVSNLGRVKTLPKNGGNGDMERILKQGNENGGYKSVRFSRNGKTKKYAVHRLVCKAFNENKDNKPFVNHLNNDPSDNRAANLEWCTHSENMLHAQKQGRLFKAQSEGGKNGGMTNMLRSIKRLEDLGVTVLKYCKGKKHNGRRSKSRAKILTACKHQIKDNVIVEDILINQHKAYCDTCKDIIAYERKLKKLKEKQCQLKQIHVS